MASPPDSSESKDSTSNSLHWQKSLYIVCFILAVWAFISLGCGVLFRETLDKMLPNIGGAPFGFWIAQQGAIIVFLILLVTYMLLMNSLDNKHGYGKGDDQ